MKICEILQNVYNLEKCTFFYLWTSYRRLSNLLYADLTLNYKHIGYVLEILNNTCNLLKFDVI